MIPIDKQAMRRPASQPVQTPYVYQWPLLIGDSTRLEASIVDALEELFAEVVFLLIAAFLHRC